MSEARGRRSSWLSTVLSLAGGLALAVGPASAAPCVVPDNGTGTATLPPDGCDYASPFHVFKIIDGLPAGTTIELDGPLGQFLCDGAGSLCSLGLPLGVCEAPGGNLGGDGHCFSATLDLAVAGTGDLEGFSRQIAIPMAAEVHTGARMPGYPVQTFVTDMFRLEGEIVGDPDFDLLRITVDSGVGFGKRSPGETTLTKLPSGDFLVDSHFDMTYEIDFVGAPGTVLGGSSGTTTGSIWIETEVPSTDCYPTPDGLDCETGLCPSPTGACNPSCAEFDMIAGEVLVDACDCRESSEWHMTINSSLPSNACLVADNGTGTVTLPPAGCEYLSPDEVWRISDGLPPGTTLELYGPLGQFLCDGAGACTPGLPSGVCEALGGNLGGKQQCYSAILDFAATGTGTLTGFNRQIPIPMAVESHSGPRTPGEAVQTFATDLVRLQGEIVGDPDFDLLRITAGMGNGMPSPGQTTLTRLPTGDFAVDSFFDISHEIEYVGAPGSPLDGFSGVNTMATIGVETGNLPSCGGACPPNTHCTTTQSEVRPGVLGICCVMTPLVSLIFADGFESGELIFWSVPSH